MVAEWWYGNFALTDSSGRQYGAMVAYFNAGLRILSVCDLDAREFNHEVSISAPDYAQGTLDLRWGSEDHWFCNDRDTLAYQLHSKGNGIGLNLNLDSQKPPLLVGGNGLVEWPFGSSYYYSLTRLRARGRIILSENTREVEGLGWMDHQWMNFVPAAVDRSYEWFSVQLDNSSELVFWQVINPDESIESQHLTLMLPDNSVRYTNGMVLNRTDFWVSPKTGRHYCILWQLREETHSLDLAIRARHPEQEIEMSEALGFNHAIWEGGTAISGYLADEVVAGTGYAELIRPPGS
jgi:predicted secreted hydrolase